MEINNTNKELDNVLNQYIQATNTHNFENVKKCIDHEAVYWFSNDSCITTNTISEYFKATWNMIKEEKYWVENVQWISISEKTAVCIYTYYWEGYYNNSLKHGSGRATNVFNKKEGKWLLIHEHLSPFPSKQEK